MGLALSIVSLLHPISLQPSSSSNSTIRNSTLTPNTITLREIQREREGGSLRVRVALALQLKSFAIIVHISFCTISKSTVALCSEAHVAIMNRPLHRSLLPLEQHAPVPHICGVLLFKIAVLLIT